MMLARRARALVWLLALVWFPTTAALGAEQGSVPGGPKKGSQAADVHGHEDPREAIKESIEGQQLPPAPEITKRGPEAVAEHLRVVRSEATDRAKLQAARMLAGLASEGDSSALAALVAIMKDKDAGSARWMTAVALRDTKSSEAVGPLIEILNDGSIPPEVRKQAALSLGQLGDPRAKAPLLAATDDPTSTEVRYYATAALTLPGMRKLTAQVPIQLKILRDPEQGQFRRARAALYLNKRGDATMIDPLIEILLKEPRSVELVPESKGDLTANMFTAMMSSQRNVRARIAGALASHGDGRIVRPLLKVMSTAADDPVFMKGADKALRKVAEREGTKPFVAALKDPDPSVRRQAVVVLAEMPDVDKVAVLGPAVKDEDPSVRQAAAAALKLDTAKPTGGGNAPISEKK